VFVDERGDVGVEGLCQAVERAGAALPENAAVALVRATGARRARTRSEGDEAVPAGGIPNALGCALFRAGFEHPVVRQAKGHVVASGRRGATPPPSERTQLLSVILPVYNEHNTVTKVLDQLLAKEIPGIDMEVIVVESNSTDGSRDDVLAYAGDARLRVVLEDRPRGKGHAVRRGLQAARGDYVLFQDADLEYDLDDYERLLEPLRAFETGFVLGSRIKSKHTWGMRHFEREVAMSHVMNVGHIGFLALFNTVYGQKLRDPFTMYKVFRRDCLTGLTLESNRFDFDWEITAKLIRCGYVPTEVPVHYVSRPFSEGKKVRPLHDPFTWIRACMKYRFIRL
jgi:glycosyltransferase involved in cell wall biosynthesis